MMAVNGIMLIALGLFVGVAYGKGKMQWAKAGALWSVIYLVALLIYRWR